MVMSIGLFAGKLWSGVRRAAMPFVDFFNYAVRGIVPNSKSCCHQILRSRRHCSFSIWMWKTAQPTRVDCTDIQTSDPIQLHGRREKGSHFRRDSICHHKLRERGQCRQRHIQLWYLQARDGKPRRPYQWGRSWDVMHFIVQSSSSPCKILKHWSMYLDSSSLLPCRTSRAYLAVRNLFTPWWNKFIHLNGGDMQIKNKKKVFRRTMVNAIIHSMGTGSGWVSKWGSRERQKVAAVIVVKRASVGGPPVTVPDHVKCLSHKDL